ncbi:hypothetical protein EON00_02525 [Burkholderia sp. ISTR5]|nr:hypothetical protein [Burkholderia sp. ISTR5]
MLIEAWRREYNEARPKQSLDGLTPATYARRPPRHQPRMPKPGLAGNRRRHRSNPTEHRAGKFQRAHDAEVAVAATASRRRRHIRQNSVNKLRRTTDASVKFFTSSMTFAVSGLFSASCTPCSEENVYTPMDTQLLPSA